jgi:ParB family chromosome partitioning protein
VQPVLRPIAEGAVLESSPVNAAGDPVQQANLDKIPAMVRELPDEAAIMALEERFSADLNFEETLTASAAEFQLTQQIANAVGKSRVTISNLLRLIALPEEIKSLHCPRRSEMEPMLRPYWVVI